MLEWKKIGIAALAFGVVPVGAGLIVIWIVGWTLAGLAATAGAAQAAPAIQEWLEKNWT